jgi:NAD-dependent SIR2 family protein deacetylase
MEAFLIEALMKGLVSAGLPALLLAFAVFWQTKGQARSESKLEKVIDSWQTDVKALFTKRIDDLEKRSESCEKDRDDLRKIIWSHLEHDATLCKTCTHFNPSPQKTDAITTRY